MTEICYAYNWDDPNCTHRSTLKSCTDYPRPDTGLAPPLPRTDFADGATWGHRIIKDLQSGASGWIYWNLLLDTNGGPFNLSPSHNDAPNNYQHPLVIVDGVAGSFQRTGLFDFLAHFSRFVRPGSRRLGTKEHGLPSGVSAVAFSCAAKAGCNAILQTVNRGTEAQTVSVCSGDGKVVELHLPPLSIATAKW